MKQNEVEQQIENQFISWEKKTKWYAYIDFADKLYAIPDRSTLFGGYYSGISKGLKTRGLEPSDEIMAVDSQFITDILMQLRYSKRMKFGDLPQNYIIFPGNPDDIEAIREKTFGEVIH